jgi:uncharacterized membrane protein
LRGLIYYQMEDAGKARQDFDKAIALAKLFIYDIRGISEGGKIAAFISLGIVLLVISFMYQNLKRLILADDSTNQRPVE